MVLLHSINFLSKKYNWRIAVAHFNHRLRGAAAMADQCVVTEYVNQNELNICIGNWRKDAAPIKKHGIEMAAREERYKFLTTAAKKHKCKYIAIAHHADDQAETFLWRMMRGAGGEGLRLALRIRRRRTRTAYLPTRGGSATPGRSRRMSCC